MGNVHDAMRKHAAERAAHAAAGDERPAAERGAAPAEARAAPATQDEPRWPARRARPITNGYAPELVAHGDRGGRLAEEYRALRTNLLAQYEDSRFCLLVTSAQGGEGKTVTCLNLAFVLAEMVDRRTVVVDCDLQKSNVNALLRQSASPGLAEVLRGETPLAEALRETTCENLHILTAGRVEEDETGELMGRPELEDLIGGLRKDYDFVLLDTPPVHVAGSKRQYGRSISHSTAGILGRTAQDALLVVRMNKTRRESVEAALRQLRAAHVRPVGLVLTHQRHVIPECLYRLF